MQGRLVLRDFVEVYNLPPERRFVSVCTPHEGIGICPEAYQMVCPLWNLAPYTAWLAFADYGKDATDKSTYLDRSHRLAEFNNEQYSLP